MNVVLNLFEFNWNKKEFLHIFFQFVDTFSELLLYIVIDKNGSVFLIFIALGSI